MSNTTTTHYTLQVTNDRQRGPAFINGSGRYATREAAERAANASNVSMTAHGAPWVRTYIVPCG